MQHEIASDLSCVTGGLPSEIIQPWLLWHSAGQERHFPLCLYLYLPNLAIFVWSKENPVLEHRSQDSTLHKEATLHSPSRPQQFPHFLLSDTVCLTNANNFLSRVKSNFNLCPDVI